MQNPKMIVVAAISKSVGSIRSGEKGELVSAVYAVCAAGCVLTRFINCSSVIY